MLLSYIMQPVDLWKTYFKTTTKKTPSVIYVQVYYWKKYLFHQSGLFPYYLHFFPNHTILHTAVSQGPQCLFSPSRSFEVQSHSSVGVKVNNWLALLHGSCGFPDERDWREIFSTLFFDPRTWQAWGLEADAWSTLLHLSKGQGLPNLLLSSLPTYPTLYPNYGLFVLV